MLLTGILVVAMITGGGVSLAAARTWYVSPTGTGSSCSTSSPCLLPTAVSAATGGETVVLAGGSYGDVTVRGGSATALRRLTITGAPGAVPVFGRLETYSPYITWRSVTATIEMYLYPAAVGTTVDKVTLDGAGLFIRSRDITVSSSTFHGGRSIDGIQIGRASDVLLVGNDIHDYTQDGTSGYHADCIQMFDSSRITIRSNKLRNCYNSAVIFSPGAGTGVSNVLLEANFIQGCLVLSRSCGNGNALDLRYSGVSDITLRNNTFRNGSVRLQSPGVVFDRNIVSYLSDCRATFSNSVIGSWNSGLCAVPADLGTKGNRQGVVTVVDEQSGNLHLTAASQARIVPVPGISPAPFDYDGQPAAGDLAGADTPSGAMSTTPPGTPSNSDRTAPSVSIVSPSDGSSVKGVVTLKSNASDNVGVRTVRYFASTVLIGNATYSGGTWNASVDVTGLRAGSYQLIARAVDAAGNSTDSAPIKLRIQ